MPYSHPLVSGFLVLIGLFLAVAVWSSFWDVMHSGSWVENPCIVDSSEVIRGRHYSIDVHYHYTFQNRDFQSNRYYFIYSSGTLRDQQEIVSQYPPGAVKSCFIDPVHPSHSVLDREWSWSLLIPFLTPLGFITIGAVGLYRLYHYPRLRIEHRT